MPIFSFNCNALRYGREGGSVDNRVLRIRRDVGARSLLWPLRFALFFLETEAASAKQ